VSARRAGPVILGGGVTGLAAGVASGATVLEAAESPGGICRSYYLSPRASRREAVRSGGGDGYRFEVGGGHWIFGGDAEALKFLDHIAPLRTYRRRAAVYFSAEQLLVPYPLQNNLRAFGPQQAAELARDVLADRSEAPAATMSQWLERTFGPRLSDLFFHPFHARYTAGLWSVIAPQDASKSTIDRHLVSSGARTATPAVGYNAVFRYPRAGLGTLTGGLADRAKVRYGKLVVHIDTEHRIVDCADGSATPYSVLLSSLPLNRMMRITGLDPGVPADPSTSVLVVNIGAARGPQMPAEHWLYTPDSKSGFHRVGCYSNVDPGFLPPGRADDEVSLYVEYAFRGGSTPVGREIDHIVGECVNELRAWRWIGQVHVVDPTFVEVGYTWSWPGSEWVSRSLTLLSENGIRQIGRYGRWSFQGIAQSVAEGLEAGRALTCDR